MSGWERVTSSGWNETIRQTRRGRWTRARNVANARVPASAWWRSSMTSAIGRRSPIRIRTPRIPSSSRAWRRSGEVTVRRSGSVPVRASRVWSSGTSRRPSSIPGPSSSTSSSSVAARSVGRIARRIGAYGSSVPAGTARPRSTVNGSARAESRVIASVRKRLAPMPPVPSIRTVVGTPPMAASSAGAIRANADSRPTNFALVNPAGMDPILGARPMATTPCRGRNRRGQARARAAR